MTRFSFDALRRFPDVEAANLYAVDATDRLLLREADEQLRSASDGQVVVVNDQYGALTLGAAAEYDLTGIRVHQDLLTGEQALANNAALTGLAERYRSLPLDAQLFAGARVVLVQAPKSIDALREIAELVARHAGDDVTVYVGGRVKHLTRAVNDVLAESFEQVRASLAAQKSRLIIGSAKLPVTAEPSFPRRRLDPETGLWVCTFGMAFAGLKLDLGTRRLLLQLDRLPADPGTAVDLGCGTGILAASMARARPALSVIATDQSAAAVASAAETMRANGLQDRVSTLRDDAMSTLADGSVDVILCNPPFHLGNSVHTGAALKMFRAAGRVLRPGGQLWTVFNSHLAHQPALERYVGATRVADRDPKFTVTVSRRR